MDIKPNQKLKQRGDQINIPEGYFFELYTPGAGRIVSPSLERQLKFAKMYLHADANVTFKDAAGNQSNNVPISKGSCHWLVSEIIDTGEVAVSIIHDGVPYKDNENS